MIISFYVYPSQEGLSILFIMFPLQYVLGFSYNQYFKKMSSSLQSPKSNTQKNHVSALKS